MAVRQQYVADQPLLQRNPTVNSPATHSNPTEGAFELRTFGGLSLRARGGSELVSILSQPKRAALLCRLALARGFVRRDLLLPLFWPESDDAHARASLRQAIHFLRQSLGERALLSRGDEEIKVNEELIWCDAPAFEQAIAEQRNEKAFALYRGDFLPGFFVTGAAELDQWLDGERERLRRRAIANAWSLAEERERAGDADGAAEFGRAAIALAPTDDALLRKFILQLERAGDPAGALAAYERYARRLRIEYEVEPAPQLQGLAREIATRQRSITPADAPALNGLQPTFANTTLRIKWRRWTEMAVPAVLLLSGTFYVARKGASSPVDARKEIVLADFANHTKDPNLATGITQALSIDLAQSRYIRFAANQRIGDVLKRMGRNRTQALTNELAREVAVREGLQAVLQGDVAELGSGYVINTRLVTADSGRVLVLDQERAKRPDDVISAVDRLAERLRKHMGEKLHGLRDNQPLAAVTTSSLDALKAYSAAMLIRRQDTWNDREEAGSAGVDIAARLMQRAVEIDSTFAAAYRSYGAYLFWRGERARANDMLTRAFQLRNRLTEEERLLTEGTYYSFVREDIDNALARFQELLQINPRSNAALQHLMLLYYLRRDYTRAAYYADREWAVHGGGAPARLYVTIMLGAGRVARADSFLRYYAARETKAGFFTTHLILLEQARQNYRAVDTLISRLPILTQRSSPMARAAAIRLIGSYRIARGAYSDGAALLREAFAQTDPVTKLTLAFNLALYDVFVLHDAAGARLRLDAALHVNPITSLPSANRPYLNVAEAYAFAGDHDRANTLLREYHAIQATLTTGDFKRSAAYNTDALIEASQGHLARAREIMAQGEREIGCWESAHWLRLGRAMVEDLAGNADSTIAAWERFVAVPSCLVVTTVDGAYASAMGLAHAHERLAQLYDARGDVKQAIAHYGKFLETLATPDPVLQPRWNAAERRLQQLLDDGRPGWKQSVTKQHHGR